ncbi:MAG: F0F1 ATP synthase subunit B [Bacteroidales bacterium]|nr:F0F1 ATP synthase subunit B [Bacteroidales bacterium]
MDLLLPDTGLLLWMVLIFGIVFFLLAKFGFPVITRMVERRNAYIASSLQKAEEARAAVERLAQEQEELLENTRQQQGRLLREAAEAREKMLAAARKEAAEAEAHMLENARKEIAAEKEAALRDIRQQVSLLSLEIAGKLVSRQLSRDDEQLALLDRLMDEVETDRKS